MISILRASVVCCFILLLIVGSSTVQPQMIQGSDYGSTQFTNPSTWSSVPIEPTSTVTFKLNTCEYALYLTEDNEPRSCMPREVGCDKLADMEGFLAEALDLWNSLDGDLLLEYGGRIGTCEQGCPSTDIWEDDSDWVITRTYDPEDPLNPTYCPGVNSAPQEVGGALRLYDDDPGDRVTRYVRECDIVFFESKWEASEPDCLNAEPELTGPQCRAAWKAALAHEVGHCLGFGHSYLTRRSLDPISDDLDLPQGVDILDGLPALMSYDRLGNVVIGGQGHPNKYDQALFLRNYATDPDPDGFYFTASGQVSRDCGETGEELLFGAAVFALEVDENGDLTPLHLSMTGVHPLGSGEFSLDFLERGKYYRLLVVDARNPNHMLAHGWSFSNDPWSTPGLHVFRTDLWDENHSGDAYKYETSARFATGFAPVLTDAFLGPQSGDPATFDICVTPEL